MKDFDPSRFLPDRSGRFGFYQVHQWGPTSLILAVFGEFAADESTRDLQGHLQAAGIDVAVLRDDPFLFQLELPDGEDQGLLWPIEVMIRAWTVSLNTAYARSTVLKNGRPDGNRGVHLDQLEHWVADTRKLAEEARAVFGSGSGLPDAMLDWAQQVEDVTTWPDRWLRSVGPRDPVKRADLLLNVELWALDQLFKAIDDTVDAGRDRMTQPYWTRKIFEPATEILEVNHLPVLGSEAWKMRIYRVEQQILPDAREALMAEVLVKLRDEEITRGLEIPPSL